MARNTTTVLISSSFWLFSRLRSCTSTFPPSPRVIPLGHVPTSRNDRCLWRSILRSVMGAWTWVTRARRRQRLQKEAEDRQQCTAGNDVSVLESTALEEWTTEQWGLTRPRMPHCPQTLGHTARAAVDEQCPSSRLQGRPRSRRAVDRQRTALDRRTEGCRRQTATTTARSGCTADTATLSPRRRGDPGDVWGWTWKLFQGMTARWRCMLLASWTQRRRWIDLSLKHQTCIITQSHHYGLLTNFKFIFDFLNLSIKLHCCRCIHLHGFRYRFLYSLIHARKRR